MPQAPFAPLMGNRDRQQRGRGLSFVLLLGPADQRAQLARPPVFPLPDQVAEWPVTRQFARHRGTLIAIAAFAIVEMALRGLVRRDRLFKPCPERRKLGVRLSRPRKAADGANVLAAMLAVPAM